MNLELMGTYLDTQHEVSGTVLAGINNDNNTYIAILGLSKKLHKGASETQYKVPDLIPLQVGYEVWFANALIGLSCEFKEDTGIALEEAGGITDWLLVTGIEQQSDVEEVASKLLKRYTDLVKDGILY